MILFWETTGLFSALMFVIMITKIPHFVRKHPEYWTFPLDLFVLKSVDAEILAFRNQEH